MRLLSSSPLLGACGSTDRAFATSFQKLGAPIDHSSTLPRLLLFSTHPRIVGRARGVIWN